eukprot:968364-Amphidinium_carterae.1
MNLCGVQQFGGVGSERFRPRSFLLLWRRDAPVVTTDDPSPPKESHNIKVLQCARLTTSS